LETTRQAAGVPFTADEMLLTTHEAGAVLTRAAGLAVLATPLRTPCPDPLLAPDITQPAAVFEAPAPPVSPPGPPPPAC
jgi:hypothetical protein